MEGGEELALQTRPTYPDFNTDHFPNFPSSGNHLGIGRLAKFHWTFVSPGELPWALVSLLFVWGARDPKKECQQLVILIRTFTLVLPYGLPPWMPKAGESLWQHLEQENEVIMGSCSEKRWELLLGYLPKASSISCSCGMGTRMPHFKKTFWASACQRKLKTVNPRSAWF